MVVASSSRFASLLVKTKDVVNYRRCAQNSELLSPIMFKIHQISSLFYFQCFARVLLTIGGTSEIDAA